MLTQLRFQNFKSWRDTKEIRMAPLTGFFGANSSGKTAILQFLLMLKQTTEVSDRNCVLFAGDSNSYVDLGTSYDFVHRHEFPSEMTFNMRWKSKNPLTEKTRLRPFNNFSSIPIELIFGASILIQPDQIRVKNFLYECDADNNHIELGIQTTEDKEYYAIIEKDNSFKSLSESANAKVYPPEKFYIFPKSSSLLAVPDVLKRKFSQNQWELSLEQQFQSIYYIGPLRDYPQRIYNWSGYRPDNMGKGGENFVSAILASNQQNLELQTKVAHWLKELRLIHDFKIESIGRKGQQYEILVQSKPNSPEASLADVGFGVSQILPILVLCYYVPEGSTIILEQPELHLHPFVQAGLADVFIDVIKNRNLQIILESHSEHLMRRLQRRIAETAQGLTNDDTALYFCNVDDTSTSHLETLQIDPYGNITNWPENFFGDEMGDLIAMTEAAMQRQMQEPAH